MNSKISWNNIKNLKEHYITYLLYKEGKSIDTISIIRRLDKKQVENHIIKTKIELNTRRKKKPDKLISIISMSKDRRVRYLEKISEKDKDDLAAEIYKRYVSFKNYEDRMILIWLIGELRNEKLLPLLRMELSSNNGNLRRLSCSALGKIGNKDTKEWLENVLNDSNAQVRQYSAKALGNIGDEESIKLLEPLLEDEKSYVRRDAKVSIEKIKKL
ncbi:MAG TPA: HEAT repeat domain-containing protein [Tissierellales bacterium]|nr:HEAT repeat domain-containing protein [Tissierellales bacterium]